MFTRIDRVSLSVSLGVGLPRYNGAPGLQRAVCHRTLKTHEIERSAAGLLAGWLLECAARQESCHYLARATNVVTLLIRLPAAAIGGSMGLIPGPHAVQGLLRCRQSVLGSGHGVRTRAHLVQRGVNDRKSCPLSSQLPPERPPFRQHGRTPHEAKVVEDELPV